jgi:hypothetical protein
MTWVLDIFGENENPYVIRLWSKFQPDPDHGFQNMAILLMKTNFLEGRLNRCTLEKDTVRLC